MPWPQRGQGVQPWAQAHGSLAPQGRPHVLASMPSPDISRRPRAVGSHPRLHATVPAELFVLLTHSPWADAHGFITWSLRDLSCSLSPWAGAYGFITWSLRDLSCSLSPWADAHGFITWSLRNYSCSLLTHRGLTPTALSPGPYGTFRALSRLRSEERRV